MSASTSHSHIPEVGDQHALITYHDIVASHTHLITCCQLSFIAQKFAQILSLTMSNLKIFRGSMPPNPPRGLWPKARARAPSLLKAFLRPCIEVQILCTNGAAFDQVLAQNHSRLLENIINDTHQQKHTSIYNAPLVKLALKL